MIDFYKNDKKIKELENLIMSINIDRFRKFVCLESTEQYFNQYGLCGVVYDGNKYIYGVIKIFQQVGIDQIAITL